MAAVDALAEHVKTWTVCDPGAITERLQGATTEQEKLDVVLGSPMEQLLDAAQGKSSELEAKADCD